MLSKNTMITFYRACGYDEQRCVLRASHYMLLQSQFNESLKLMEKMAEEDEQKLEEMKNER